MRTEAELNEYLALARGFRTNMHVTEARYPTTWRDPEGGYADEPPDFCHSVDACLKWLGPKLHYWEVTTVSTGFRAHLGTKVGLFSNIEATPALAFARAAEQAMDAEKGVGGK